MRLTGALFFLFFGMLSILSTTASAADYDEKKPLIAKLKKLCKGSEEQGYLSFEDEPVLDEYGNEVCNFPMKVKFLGEKKARWGMTFNVDDFSASNSYPIITCIAKGASCGKRDKLYGRRIISVNGQSLMGMSREGVLGLIAGIPEGEAMILTVQPKKKDMGY